ncbi:MAG: hypothetical protein PHZ19_01540 [Candidatus Thermoplasmatota archaeon]|nr:hypothetical protein [Candidatus Thermoplasmatota archaeon]
MNSPPNENSPPKKDNPLLPFVRKIEELYANKDEILQIDTLDTEKREALITAILEVGGGGGLIPYPHLAKLVGDQDLARFLTHCGQYTAQTLNNKNDRIVIAALLNLGYVSQGLLVHELGFDKGTAKNALKRLEHRQFIHEAEDVSNNVELLKFKELLNLTFHNFKSTKWYELNYGRIALPINTLNIPPDTEEKLINLKEEIDNISIHKTEGIERENEIENEIKKLKDKIFNKDHLNAYAAMYEEATSTGFRKSGAAWASIVQRRLGLKRSTTASDYVRALDKVHNVFMHNTSDRGTPLLVLKSPPQILGTSLLKLEEVNDEMP